MNVVLVDTSVWIAFFNGDPTTLPLQKLLVERRAHVHAWVLGELHLGSGVPTRAQAGLRLAPRVAAVPDDDSWRFLEAHRLHRSGIGWVDLQLLATAHARGIALWTADDDLAAAARQVRLPALRLS